MSWDDTIVRGGEFNGFLKALDALGIPHRETEVTGHFELAQYGDPESLHKVSFTVAPGSGENEPGERIVEEYLQSVDFYDDGSTHTVAIAVYKAGNRPDLDAEKRRRARRRA